MGAVRMQRLRTQWHRWCLPAFNRHCNQYLKGAMADNDNSLCDGKQVKRHVLPNRKRTRKELCPWEHPTLITFLF